MRNSNFGMIGGSQVRNPKFEIRNWFLVAAAALGCVAAARPTPTPTPPPVLAEIDRIVRAGFWDSKLKGVDWNEATSRAAGELSRSQTSAQRDAIYDRLLAQLQDSHT